MGNISFSATLVMVTLIALNAMWQIRSLTGRRVIATATLLVAVVYLVDAWIIPITLPLDLTIHGPINSVLAIIAGIVALGGALHRFVTDCRAATAKRLASEAQP